MALIHTAKEMGVRPWEIDAVVDAAWWRQWGFWWGRLMQEAEAQARTILQDFQNSWHYKK